MRVISPSTLSHTFMLQMVDLLLHEQRLLLGQPARSGVRVRTILRLAQQMSSIIECPDKTSVLSCKQHFCVALSANGRATLLHRRAASRQPPPAWLPIQLIAGTVLRRPPQSPHPPRLAIPLPPDLLWMPREAAAKQPTTALCQATAQQCRCTGGEMGVELPPSSRSFPPLCLRTPQRTPEPPWQKFDQIEGALIKNEGGRSAKMGDSCCGWSGSVRGINHAGARRRKL